ncbi:hypothetical protein RI129_007439 [Pyrocoelia pectoralis]|uniref:Hyaluronan-mediated motility receptor C-terminal domain-containing protein n=1 Tax=Pyrocoelia pectoralis TaxID=417401 RepID=A0AAN7VHT6_9COLE
MSFPKAKLQRFNDIQDSTPSPADYNISTKNHVSGAIISKTERFTELRSPASSDSSFISNGAVPTFKTPNPPRLLKGVSTNVNRKTKQNLFATADDAEALKDKIVECNNKDLFIQELTEDVEELKQELNDLQNVISKLKEDKYSLELNMEKLNVNHADSLRDLKENYELEIESLKKKTLEVSQTLDTMKNILIALKEDTVEELKSLLKSFDVLQNLIDLLNKNFQLLIVEKTDQLTAKTKQIQELEDNISVLEKVHLQEVDELKRMHQKEIQTLESDMLKTVTNMHNIIDTEKENGEKRLKQMENLKRREIDVLKGKFIEQKIKLTEDFELKIQQQKEDFKEATILTEIQTREKCDAIELRWKTRVEEVRLEADAILRECQAIAEYNVIQSEIEKNKVLYELSEEKKKTDTLLTQNLEIKNNYVTLDTKRKTLESKLSSVIIELNTTRQELGQEIEQCKEDIKKATKDRNLYELTVQKTHKTVEALKKRLMKSDQDVEQLKAELEATEESKLEVEGKCNQLMQELEILTDLCDVIEEQNKLSVDASLVQLKEELLNKVDTFKSQADEEIKLKENELNRVKKDLSDARKLLHDQHILNSKAQECISVSQNEIKHLEVLNEKLTVSENIANNLLKENSKLTTVIEFMQASESDLLKQLRDLKNESKTCQCNSQNMLSNPSGNDELNKKYLELLERLKLVEDENSQLRTTVDKQNCLIGPFRDSLKAYEMEYAALMNEKQHAEKEAQEMGMKYADILGHQNQKQKIKHLTDLKKKNIALNEEIQKLELKTRSQARTIENLKSELTPKKLLKKNKENLDQSNGSLNTSRIDSPGPLKDRN